MAQHPSISITSFDHDVSLSNVNSNNQNTNKKPKIQTAKSASFTSKHDKLYTSVTPSMKNSNNYKRVSWNNDPTARKKNKRTSGLGRTAARSLTQRTIKDDQKRKRTKKEQKKWKKKMKEIGKNHPEFELSYDLLLGIRTSTSTVNSSVIRSSINPADDDSSSDDDDDLLEKEFQDSKRYSFPSSGSSQTPPHHMNDFEFKDYCRPIFAQLRDWFGIQPATYLIKLCGGFNLLEFISNSKSGQFFFYSHDGQFLIKSMTRSECKLMRKILPQYYYYVKNQPNTLLTKFYGMYRVKTHNRQPIYFIVMGSVFYTDLDVHKIYDLKGSTHGRRAKPKEKEQDVPVLKDLDFLENNEIIYIGDKAKLFKQQLKRDTQLLKKLKIMDYSLLVGVHYTNKKDNDLTSVTVTPSMTNSNTGSNKKKNIKIKVSTPTPPLDPDPDPTSAITTITVTDVASTTVSPVVNVPPNVPTINDNDNDHKIDDDDDDDIALPKASNLNLDKQFSYKSNSTSASMSSIMDSAELKKHQNAINGDPIPPISSTATANNNIVNKGIIKNPIHPIQSTTAPSNDIELSVDANSSNITNNNNNNNDNDLDQKNDAFGAPTKQTISTPTPTTSNTLHPTMQRVTSRRLSQISTHKSQFTVKTPIEANFDMPELVDLRRLKSKLEEIEEEEDEFQNIFATDNGGMQMVHPDGKEGPQIYFCGIIDILQKYNKRKKVENFFRGLNTDVNTISAVPPDKYSQRMYDFLKDRIK